MKKRRAEEGDQAPAHQDGDPCTQRRAGNELDAQGRARPPRQRLDVLERAGAVESEDVDPGHRHEHELEAERVVVEILLRMAGKEYDVEEEISDIAGDPPWNEPVNGAQRNALGDPERAQVEKTDRADQEREA